MLKRIKKKLNPKKINPKYGLLSCEVEKELKAYQERKGIKQLLSYPRKDVVFKLLISFTVFFVIPFIYVSFNGDDIIKCPLSIENRSSSSYKTIWGIQASLTAAALPILMFIIDLTKDVKQAATRSAEVLIRESSIFPVIMFSMSGCIALGLYLPLSENNIIFYFGLLVFLVTVSLTMFSYYKALSLIFDPSKLKSKSVELLKEKMSKLLDYSIETRLGSNRFIAKLTEMGVEYNPFEEDPKSSYILESKKLVVIDDINIIKLEDFIAYLTEKLSKAAGLSDIPADASPAGETLEKPDISILKTYRDEVTRDRNGLIAISRKIDIAEREIEELEIKLQGQNIFRIRDYE